MSANHLADRLKAASRGREDQPFAHLPDGITRTYGDLWARVHRNASALRAAGARQGDRVAVSADKSLEALELVLGTVLAGGVILPLNPAYTAGEMAYFLEDAEPAVFICDGHAEETLAPVARAAGVRHTATLDAAGAGSWTDAVAMAPADEPATPRGAGDLAAILYTSGTTGRSKGAMLSHRALASNAGTLAAYWRFSPDDVLIHALPIFHTHGLFVATNVALSAGCAMIFQRRFDADAVISALPNATALMGVPTFYTRLLDHPGLTREAAAGMRVFISGSAPLLTETHERFRAATGHAILERYGMTETGMNTSNPYDGERRPGTAGFPLPGIEVRVTDPARAAPLPRGEIGMIEVRGPNVFDGYWRMPDKTAEEKRPDGFFMTGDLGVFDGDGYLSIVGRSKDLVISGGFNVYPKEVEGEIDALPGVRESAVVGVPHPDFGEGVFAVVVPEAGAALDEWSILSALAVRIARYKQPKRVAFVEALPRNAMGKVQKAALRERFADAFDGSGRQAARAG